MTVSVITPVWAILCPCDIAVVECDDELSNKSVTHPDIIKLRNNFVSYVSHIQVFLNYGAA